MYSLWEFTIRIILFFILRQDITAEVILYALILVENINKHSMLNDRVFESVFLSNLPRFLAKVKLGSSYAAPLATFETFCETAHIGGSSIFFWFYTE